MSQPEPPITDAPAPSLELVDIIETLDTIDETLVTLAALKRTENLLLERVATALEDIAKRWGA